MDAVASFQHIVESVPQWRSQLTELALYAAGKHEEFVAEYARLLHQVKLKRHKSESIDSIHSCDEEPLTSPQPSELAEINPLEAGNRFIYAQARRKRRPGTSIRSNASGSRKIRKQQMVVIYYDSRIQSDLDALVKSFGVARNNLRRGKNAYTATKGFSLPTLTRRFDMENLVPNMILKSAPHLLKAQSDPVSTTAEGSLPDTAFMNADKELDVVQSLCESAAHQVIRDGDCTPELNQAISKLDVVFALADSTLHILEAEKRRQGDTNVAEEGNCSASDSASGQSTLCEKISNEAMNTRPKTLPSLTELKRPALPALSSAPAGPMVIDAIEVDEDEDDDEGSLHYDLDLSKYRHPARQYVA